jgi:Uma2 family endonuclease
MVLVILDRDEQKALIRDRRERGIDRFDEVWDGVYIVSPIADNEHQELGLELAMAIRTLMREIVGIRVFPGCNVSDQNEKWKRNFRCPDVAVFLAGNPAEDRGSHWYGGPDFAIEVISPYDRSRGKLDFYARVGVRELMLVARKPWALELYRLSDGELRLVGKVLTPADPALASEVLPLTFRFLPGVQRPRIEIAQTLDGQTWLA